MFTKIKDDHKCQYELRERHPVDLSGVVESEAKDGASKPNLLWGGGGPRHRPFYQVKRNMLVWLDGWLVGCKSI